jgi:hypothetical protein
MYKVILNEGMFGTTIIGILKELPFILFIELNIIEDSLLVQ